MNPRQNANMHAPVKSIMDIASSVTPTGFAFFAARIHKVAKFGTATE